MSEKTTEQRPARILVIDDEVTQRILVKEYLEEAGYVVRLSDDGRRGLKMAANTKPDLIILDLMLPSMDGYTLCTCLKQTEATAHIPIILITASREPGVIDRGLSAGADDFVTKPVDWAFLADRVKMVLARHDKARSEHAAAAPAPQAGNGGDAAAEDRAAVAVAEARAEADNVRQRLVAELATAKAAAKADLSAADERYAEKLAAFRLAATKEVETIRNAARLEITRTEQRHGEQLAAMRQQVETVVKETGGGQQAALREENARLAAELSAARGDLQALKEASRQQPVLREENARLAAELSATRGDLQALKEASRQQAVLREENARLAAELSAARDDLQALKEVSRQRAEELHTTYDLRLAAAEQKFADAEAWGAGLEAAAAQLKSDFMAEQDAYARERGDMMARIEAERASLLDCHAAELETARREAAAAQAALDPDPRQIEALDAEYGERVRSAWELVNAALVSYLDRVAEISRLCKAAAGVADGGEALGRAEQRTRELQISMGKLRMLSQVLSGGADLRDTIFDFSKLASDAVAAVKATADEQKVALALALPKQPVVVRADHARLSYAIVSLIVNALRHTPQGGSIGVSLGIEDGAARLEVADTGIGIAPVLLDGLRTCLERPGDIVTGRGEELGLGLPIAAALVRQHGGSLEIDSGLGRGTLVAIALPLGRRSETRAAGAPGRRRLTG